MFYKLSLTGDVYSELTQFLIAAVLVLVLTLAWWTTSIRDSRPIRTVYLLDTRLRRARQIRRLTHDIVSSTLVESTTETASNTTNEVSTETNNVEENKPPEATTSDNTGDNSPNNCEEEQSRIVETMDADSNVIRQRRLAFFESRSNITNPAQSNEQTSSNQDAIMEHNYADRNMIDDVTQASDMHSNDPQSIRVKLKFLNDDLKLVDGKLEEALGDFKRRHFEVEMSTNKLVKLIFNGKLLQHDNDTLQTYGFFDNCVVHCVIHQQRTNRSEENVEGHNRRSNGRINQRDWDLGNLLIVLFSLVLSTAWYFRYQYPQFFTVTATVALVAITGIFTIVSIGMYFPDTDAIRPQTHVIR